jgi:hypothetical protein
MRRSSSPHLDVHRLVVLGIPRQGARRHRLSMTHVSSANGSSYNQCQARSPRSGFRPFFLAGTVYAGLGLLIWLLLFVGELTLPTAFSPLDWHIHELLYGYLLAIITEFLLTAIPNWSGRLPLQGGALGCSGGGMDCRAHCRLHFRDHCPLAAGVLDVLFFSSLPPRRPARSLPDETGAICRQFSFS